MAVRYKIHTLFARTMTGYAAQEDGGRYSYHLNQTATRKCFRYGEEEQEDNALFYQALCVLNGGSFPKLDPLELRPELEDVIFYMDFSGIFDGGGQRNPDRQKKAESMFRPEGVTLDFGSGAHTYLAFERSGNMSRAARLSFLRSDIYDEVRRRIMLDMTVGRCQLSKLYAYLGLMLSGGTRIEGIGITKPHRVVVVEDELARDVVAKVITVEGGELTGGVRKYRRVEKRVMLTAKRFDGEGLISWSYADYRACHGKPFKRNPLLAAMHEGPQHSFQIRMPFVKGMLHQVDFQDYVKSAGGKTVTDVWGVRHPVDEVDVILTRSMFKGYGWLTENGMTWDDYLAAFERYDHALYITNAGKSEPQKYTELNYQFLSTLSMTDEEFRPRDLPKGWTHSPASDTRNWITKATEQRYYDLCANPAYRLSYFTEKEDSVLARVLRKNPLFIHEPICTRELDDQAEHVLEQYVRGRLLVAGDNRFLSGDLHRFLLLLVDQHEALGGGTRRQATFNAKAIANRNFIENSFYAPGAVYEHGDACTLLRNPHIARNEEIQLAVYKDVEQLRKHYLGGLRSVVMVEAEMLAAERLGGADFDGDMVKTIADPLLNECVRRNYGYSLNNLSNLPLLYIPSEDPVIRDANDWHDRFITVRDTFSSRIGQICNAAFDRSIVAYDESLSDEERRQCREETETLAILTGLEIDSAKSGIKPDLDEYLKRGGVRRNRYLQYKVLLDDDGDRVWYAPTPYQKRKEFLRKTDWEQVTSNVERLPLLAEELKAHTPKIKPIPARDEELFTFAAEPGWKYALDRQTLSAVDALLRDYEACLSRIRACRAPIANRRRRNDIERVLYARGQEEHFDLEQLYADFTLIEPERVTELRKLIRERNWHLMNAEARRDFLTEYLPELEDSFPLLSDFRHRGYRVLADLVMDVDDENNAEERKNLFREKDSEAFTEMMRAYVERPRSRNYRAAAAAVCRRYLNRIVKPRDAVRYVVALGKRKLLWDLLEDQILRNVLRVKSSD